METNKRPSEEWLLCPSKMEKIAKIKKNFRYVDAYTKHKMLINEYMLTHKGAWNSLERDNSGDVTDKDILRQNHRFVWEGEEMIDGWEKRMAKKYYDKLFKEYCISDLRRYKENKIALRWRTETEVVKGKGQFICADLNCDKDKGLKSWLVNFSYVEDNEKKTIPVKIRLCAKCSYKLNYHHQKKEVPPPNSATGAESNFIDSEIKVKEEIQSEPEDASKTEHSRPSVSRNQSTATSSQGTRSTNNGQSKEQTKSNTAMALLDKRMDSYLSELLL